MPSAETLAAFSVAAFLLCISPGPSNLYIMARSISQGHRAGIVAATGMAIGSVIYVLASAFGLAALFIYFPLAFSSVKLAGAGYLIYLALHYFKLARHSQRQDKPVVQLRNTAIFRQSIIVELTNPKTALFFIAFLPLFVDPARGQISLQLLVLGVVYAAIGLMCDLMVASLAGQIGKWLSQHADFSVWQNRIAAGLLFLLGAFILYQESIQLVFSG